MTVDKQDQVFEVVAKIARKEKSQVKLEHELLADLGIDSPKGLQLLMDLEEKFKIEITDEDAARMNTVGDIVKYVTSH
jgi:acyl carrier protein